MSYDPPTPSDELWSAIGAVNEHLDDLGDVLGQILAVLKLLYEART